jgi:hypothetical protein
MKYLICAFPPTYGGVGRLLTALIPEYEADGYSFIGRRIPSRLKSFSRSRLYFILAGFEFVRQKLDKVLFFLRCLFVFDSDIVFLHPQSSGWWLLFRLARHNRVNLYVMDNSFFCMMSYNAHPIHHHECLQCLKDFNPHPACRPYPGSHTIDRAKKNISNLKILSGKIRFLAQCESQVDLLKAHFGKTIDYEIIGLDTKEIEVGSLRLSEKQKNKQYDVVYHAVASVPKGILYTLSLANLLPNYRFFIPASDKDVLERSGKIPANVTCIDISWETGLKEIVRNARVVLNTSVWSAPIEGALLKSAAYNSNVATVKSKFGFEGSIASIENHIRLSSSSKQGAAELDIFIKQIQTKLDLM